GFWSGGTVTVAVPLAPPRGHGLSLAIASSNPARTETRITLEVPERAPVHLAVYSISGRLVRVLVDRVCDVGAQEVRWNGADAAGRRVPDGVYFLRVRAGSHAGSARLVVLD